MTSARNGWGMNVLVEALFGRVVPGVAIDAPGMAQHRVHLHIVADACGFRIRVLFCHGPFCPGLVSGGLGKRNSCRHEDGHYGDGEASGESRLFHKLFQVNRIAE